MPVKPLPKLPVAPAPRHIQRRVVWRKEAQGKKGDRGTAILLVGYCPQTLPYYLGMLQELLKTFPNTDLNEVGFHQVTRSPSVQGFTLLMAPIKGPKRRIKDYDEYESVDFNY